MQWEEVVLKFNSHELNDPGSAEAAGISVQAIFN